MNLLIDFNEGFGSGQMSWKKRLLVTTNNENRLWQFFRKIKAIHQIQRLYLYVCYRFMADLECFYNISSRIVCLIK